jgi:MFS transporter, putative metabolite:H+ symporter
MFLINLMIYSGFSLAAAFSPDLTWLAILRFGAGFGLGAELSLSDTYLSELLPRQVRGRYMASAYTLGFFGVPLAALVGGRFVAGHQILGTDGWRWLLVIGSLGAVIVFAMRRSLPESPRWHEIRGRHDEADRATSELEDRARAELNLSRLPEPGQVEVAPAHGAPVSEIFREPYRRRTVMLYIFQFFQTVGYYGFGTLAPLVLADKGFDIVESLGFSALIFVGYPLGSALSVPLMERFERKHLIVASAIAMGVLGVIFGFGRSTVVIVAAGFLLTASSNVFSNGFHIYQAEIFPTRMRSTAVSTAYSLSRMSGAMLPFISVAALDNLGPTAVFLGSAVILVIVALDVGLLGPRSTGLNLEMASDELATVPRAGGDEPRFRRGEAEAPASARSTRTEEPAEPRAR